MAVIGFLRSNHVGLEKPPDTGFERAPRIIAIGPVRTLKQDLRLAPRPLAADDGYATDNVVHWKGWIVFLPLVIHNLCGPTRALAFHDSHLLDELIHGLLPALKIGVPTSQSVLWAGWIATTSPQRQPVKAGGGRFARSRDF